MFNSIDDSIGGLECWTDPECEGHVHPMAIDLAIEGCL